jgi:hypothetical protein
MDVEARLEVSSSSMPVAACPVVQVVVAVEACLKRSDSEETTAGSLSYIGHALEKALVEKARSGSIPLQARPYQVVLAPPLCDLFEYVTLHSRSSAPTSSTRLTGTLLASLKSSS